MQRRLYPAIAVRRAAGTMRVKQVIPGGDLILNRMGLFASNVTCG